MLARQICAINALTHLNKLDVVHILQRTRRAWGRLSRPQQDQSRHASAFSTQATGFSNFIQADEGKRNSLQKSTPGLTCYNMDDDIPLFTNYPLDKAPDSRRNRDLMFELLKSPRAKIIFFHEGKCLFEPTPRRSMENGAHKELTAEKSMPTSQPVILEPYGNYQDMVDRMVGSVFLGYEKDEKRSPVFCAVINSDMHVALREENEAWAWKDVVKEAPKMNEHDCGLMGFVNGMMEFHLKNIRCGKTGQKTGPVFGGHGRAHKSKEGLAKNPPDLLPHILFPRIDPAVVVLALSGDYCLLGRKTGWGQSRYSLLAGFTEVGESLEQTCCREVLEESNVQVDVKTLQYIASQPWPFPQSLMIGYTATVKEPCKKLIKLGFPHTLSGNLTVTGEGLNRLTSKAKAAAVETNIRPDELDKYLGFCLPAARPQPGEMADVRWFHIDYLVDAIGSIKPPISLPGVHALSRRILDGWITWGTSNRTSWAGDKLKDVEIDEGEFKYVLLRVCDSNGNSKIVVRGTTSANYHADIKTAFERTCTEHGLLVDILGGGRIEHEPYKQKITIYGYSSAFGPAVHEVAGVLCQRWFPKYDSRLINVSYDGY